MNSSEKLVRGGASSTEDVFKINKNSDRFYYDDKSVQYITGNPVGMNKEGTLPIDYIFNGRMLNPGDSLEFIYLEEDLKPEKMIKVTGKLRNFMSYSNNGQGRFGYMGLILNNCKSDGGLTYDDLTCKFKEKNESHNKSNGTNKLFFFNRIVRTSLKAVRGGKRIYLPGNFVNVKHGSEITQGLVLQNSSFRLVLLPILFNPKDSNDISTFSPFSIPINEVSDSKRTSNLDNFLELNGNNPSVLELVNSKINSYSKYIIYDKDEIKMDNFSTLNNTNDYISKSIEYNGNQVNEPEPDETESPVVEKIKTPEEIITDELKMNLGLPSVKSNTEQAISLIDIITQDIFKKKQKSKEEIMNSIKKEISKDKYKFIDDLFLNNIYESLSEFYTTQYNNMADTFAEAEKDLLIWSDEKTTNMNQKLFSQLKYIDKVNEIHTKIFGTDTDQKLSAEQVNFFLKLEPSQIDKFIQYITSNLLYITSDKEYNNRIVDVMKNKKSISLVKEVSDPLFQSLKIFDTTYSDSDISSLDNALFLTFSWSTNADRTSAFWGKAIRTIHKQNQDPFEIIYLSKDGTIKSTYKMNSKVVQYKLAFDNSGVKIIWNPKGISQRLLAAPTKKIYKSLKRAFKTSGGTMKNYKKRYTKKNRQ
jgi:hypothetical protein